MSLAVVVPTFREPHHIERLLSDLRDQEYRNFRVFIVNSCPGDETSTVIESFSSTENVEEVEAEKSDFWTGAIFKGLKAVRESTADARDGLSGILCLNCDIRFEKDFLAKIIGAASRKRDSLFCCATVAGDRYVTSGVSMRSWTLSLTSHIPAGRIDGRDYPEFVPVDMLAGRALYLPARVPEEIGLPAVALLPHYGADYEYTARAKRAGYKLYVYTGTAVESDIKNTGSKASHSGSNIRKRLKLLFSKRSPSNLLYRIRFVSAVYPIATVLPGLFSIAVKTFAEVLFGRALYKRVARHHLYSD
jgi:GT2 family glycosyltransferase